MSQNAGIVTAYGAAVRGGYTGTYEEFCAEQAHIATNAQRAEEAAKTAQEVLESIPEDYTDLVTEVQGLSLGVDSLEEQISQISGGLTNDIRQALLKIAEKVVYIDEDGQDYYDDLYDALYTATSINLNVRSIILIDVGSTQQLIATTTPAGSAVTWVSSNTSVATVSSTGLVTSTGYGSCIITASSGSVSASCAVAVSQVTLASIAADYQQSGTVYDTASLDDLKSDLTVTATYSDSSTATVTEYTLSGELTVGTSTITVSYGGKTATFTVTVTAAPVLTSISAVYTQSGTVYTSDSLDSLKPDLVVTAHMSDSTTQVVTSYTLSGNLEVGTSTITVSYSGKTTTFDVTVTSGLPTGYTRVDYVSSADDSPSSSDLSSAPVIKTDFPSVDIANIINYEIECTFTPLYNGTEYVVFGCRSTSTSSNAKVGIILYGSSTKTHLHTYSSSGLVDTDLACGIIPTGTKKSIKIADGNIYVDGVLDSQINTSVISLESKYHMYVFGRNQANMSGYQNYAPMLGKMYSFSIKDENGNYVFKMIPCKRNSDDAYGMYETISETFYTSDKFSGGYDE